MGDYFPNTAPEITRKNITRIFKVIKRHVAGKTPRAIDLSEADGISDPLEACTTKETYEFWNHLIKPERRAVFRADRPQENYIDVLDYAEQKGFTPGGKRPYLRSKKLS